MTSLASRLLPRDNAEAEATHEANATGGCAVVRANAPPTESEIYISTEELAIVLGLHAITQKYTDKTFNPCRGNVFSLRVPATLNYPSMYLNTCNFERLRKFSRFCFAADTECLYEYKNVSLT